MKAKNYVCLALRLKRRAGSLKPFGNNSKIEPNSGPYIARDDSIIPFPIGKKLDVIQPDKLRIAMKFMAAR